MCMGNLIELDNYCLLSHRHVKSNKPACLGAHIYILINRYFACSVSEKPQKIVNQTRMLFRHNTLLALLCLVSLFSLRLYAQEDSTCSAETPCKSGCCSKDNKCGFGDQYCGDGCQHNCNATAECGKYAAPGHADCPINVCCRSVLHIRDKNPRFLTIILVNMGIVALTTYFAATGASTTPKVVDVTNQRKQHRQYLGSIYYFIFLPQTSH
jgi:hypothetical protein